MEVGDFFVFEDISELGVFEGNRSGGSSSGYGFGRNVISSGEVGIEVNRGGEGFLVTGNIGNCKKKELVALWIDPTRRKDSWETTFRSRIRRIG